MTSLDRTSCMGKAWLMIRYALLAATILIGFYVLLIALGHVMAAPKDGSAAQMNLARALGQDS